MSIELDHLLVPSRSPRAAAERLATLLGVPWGESRIGPFTAVYVNPGLTLDFDEVKGPVPIQHFCFRVDDATFDGILERLATLGIAFRGTSHGPIDMKVNTAHGGRIIYFAEPDGHVWEVLTLSYARRPES